MDNYCIQFVSPFSCHLPSTITYTVKTTTLRRTSFVFQKLSSPVPTMRRRVSVPGRVGFGLESF
jgi:hypothetical protein